LRFKHEKNQDKMKKSASLRVADIWAIVSAISFLLGIALAIVGAFWEPRGLGICIVPLTVAVVAKQGETRVLRSALTGL
jgi:hypothetical protein